MPQEFDNKDQSSEERAKVNRLSDLSAVQCFSILLSGLIGTAIFQFGPPFMFNWFTAVGLIVFPIIISLLLKNNEAYINLSQKIFSTLIPAIDHVADESIARRRKIKKAMWVAFLTGGITIIVLLVWLKIEGVFWS